MTAIRSLLVYCGANEGSSSVYRDAAVELGTLLAQENITLVYGGGSVGLMGIIADAVLQSGGKVSGVIPDFLHTKEIGHKGVTQMHVVSSMHERKALMEKLSDAMIALPGGFGTMDEIFEMLTWAQLGLHRKPIGLLNVNRYYDPFLAQLDVMVQEGFLRPSNRDLLIVATSPAELIRRLRAADPDPEEKWMHRGQE
jgi:uncharacterized protein (TIGR00730 family)